MHGERQYQCGILGNKTEGKKALGDVNISNKANTNNHVGRVAQSAQSVQRPAASWTVRGSNPGGARFSAPAQTGPGAHPTSCTMGTGSFPAAKSGRGVTLTPHPLLPWSRKSSAIPLLPLWAVRPVQSLSACTRLYFTYKKPLKDRRMSAKQIHKVE